MRRFESEQMEDYHALLRALDWTEGFGLFFVECSPAQAGRLTERVQQDLPRKRIKVLSLTKAVDSLYNDIAELNNLDKPDILFIRGIEKSFIEYIRPGYGGVGDYYKEDSVPRILGHFNLQRERFRDSFPVCFVFLLPRFALNYFIHRAPDFFDWRSGVFSFATEKDLLQKVSQQVIQNKDYNLSQQECTEKLLDIQTLIEESQQHPESISDLLVEQGTLFFTSGEYKQAIESYDKALEMKSNYHETWFNRGIAQLKLDYTEAALESFDKALKINPDVHDTWYIRGLLLGSVNTEAALESFDKALKINPDVHDTWYIRGLALKSLGNTEAALESFDKALKINPDVHDTWYNRGLALGSLDNTEAALESFDKALKINPDVHDTWYIRGLALGSLDNNEAALGSFDRALKINPDDHETWHSRGTVLLNLGNNEAALESFDRALEINPDDHETWFYRGVGLLNLGNNESALESFDKALEIEQDSYFIWYARGIVQLALDNNESALESFDKALKIKPDYHIAWYDKADCYAILDNVEQAIESLQQAINLAPDENWKEKIETNSNFDNIRTDERLKALIADHEYI